MPRPGPRPYECIRRPWHSNTHQPIRGSIIQQIFRIVTEAHSSATRKNKEWLEKLPRVVFKAEEIMYSKANSETEYMDPETLWERLNDAVDTIIKRDDSTEKAALILGCVPVRASRSLQHCNPRSYLSPRYQESGQPSPLTADKTSDHRAPCSRSTMANQACSTPCFDTQTVANSSYIAHHAFPHLQHNIPRVSSFGIESNTLLNFGSGFPLSYGGQCQNIESLYRFRSSQNPNPNNIIVGTPVGWPARQPSHFGNTRNHLCDNAVKPVDAHQNVADNSCDLSLRLGPSNQCTSSENGFGYPTKDGGSSCHWESAKRSRPCDKSLEFCFFPEDDANINPYESCNNRLEHEGQFQDHNASLTKLQINQFCDQSRWPGL